MKMTMVDSRGGIPTATGPIVDEDFDDILNFFDFPLESLEDDGLGVEWNASESKFLGPIPTDALMDFPPVPHGNIGNGWVNAAPNFNRPNKLAEAQGTGVFQTQSPVSVLESNNSCPGRKSISIKHDIAIPVRPRSKRPRSSAVNPWILMEPISSTRSASRKISDARKGKEKKRKVSMLSGAKEGMKNSVQQINDTMPVADVTKKLTSVQQSSFVKKCTHCEITKTPQWREGPLGPKTLCNACGVRYRSGRLFPEYRPAASPTFVPELHSNSHRKVIEMRKKAVDGSAAVEEPHKMIMGRKREALPEPTTVEDTPMSPAPEKTSSAREVPMLSGAKEAMKSSVQLINDKIPQIADVAEKKLACAQQSGFVKKCTNCEVTKTTLWREGPLGPKTLSSEEKKRKVPMLSGAKEATKSSVQQINDTMPKIADVTKKKLACAQQSGFVKKCTRCGVRKTPQWREGPLGPKTLSGQEKKTKVSMLSGAKETMKNSVQQINDKMPQIADVTKKKLTSVQQSSFVKRCTHCEVTETPQWREGPLGPKTLTGKEEKCNVSVLSGAKEGTKNSVQQINDTMPQIADVTKKKLTSVAQSSFVQKCRHCEATKTPQWRGGPWGPKTLCNACGVRYRSGRLFSEYRPTASPTFVPSLHSNSHKKVIEMIKEAVDGSAAVEEPHRVIIGRKREALAEPIMVEGTPMSPAPEFVPMSSYLFDVY